MLHEHAWFRCDIQKNFGYYIEKISFWPELKIRVNARDLIPSLASIKKLMKEFVKFAHREKFGQIEKTNNAVI